MTEAQAIKLFETKWWEGRPARELAEFQMHEDRLCMPFHVFHGAVEEALGRSVWTHELGLNADGIRAELRGERGAPSVAEIIGLIPADKRVIVGL